MSASVSRQKMVFIFLWKRFATGQFADNVIKKANIQLTFYSHFVVLFKLVSPDDIQMSAHSFNALKASSTSE